MLYDYLESKRPAIDVSGMTERQFLEAEIRRWKQSPERAAQIVGARYYRGEHDILTRRRTVIGEGGKTVEVANLPNNRLVDNQYARMVVQKANYSLGKKFVYSSDNSAYLESLSGVFTDNFYRTILNVGKSSLNCGVGWLYVYIGADGGLRFKRFEPWEILPFWTDETEHDELDMVVRVYETVEYVGGDMRIGERVEVYRVGGVEYYALVDGTLVPDANRPNAPYITKGGRAMDWGRLPIVPFRYNDDEIPLVTKVKSLQDALNETLSDFRNNMQEDHRNSILVLKNYDGENLGEFRRNLAAYGCVKVRTVDGVGGDVSSLCVEVNSENYDTVIRTLKRGIIENAMGYDAKDDRLGAAPNQMNIMSVYNDIDLDANGFESEYQASFEKLLYFVTRFLGNYENEPIEITFNRDMIMNEGDIIDNVKKSVGILSEETLVGQHPWVTDTAAELERIAAERETSADAYGDVIGGENDDDAEAAALEAAHPELFDTAGA